jgi:hypothetical protein
MSAKCARFIGQARADTLRHQHDERPIIHVEPVGATDQLIVAVVDERAVNIIGQIGVVETRHLISLALLGGFARITSSMA